MKPELKTADKTMLRLAEQSLKKNEDVQLYYRRCLRLARYRNEPHQDYVRMLAILGQLAKYQKLQPNLL